MTGRVEQLDPEKTLSIKSKGDSDASLALVFLILIGLVQVGANEPLVLAQEKNMGVYLCCYPNHVCPKGKTLCGRSLRLLQRVKVYNSLPAKRGLNPMQRFSSLNSDPTERAFVMLMPAAVPNGEADDAARFSLSGMGTGWKLPVHKAHLIVTCNTSSDALGSLSMLTSLLAAVVKASRAVGVYWGGAGATRDPKFFLATAADPDIDSRIMLWTGVSVAREANGRLSLLSVGMKQLNYPDLLLIAPKSMGNDALDAFFSFLTYIARLGKPLPEGDTIGRSATEKIPVQYVPSPLDRKTKVCRLELK